MSDPTRWLPLSTPHFHVLISLAEGDRHGYAIMQHVLELTDGRVQLWPASLYGSIAKLVRGGLVAPVSTARSETDARRRHYRITALGRRVLAAEGERLSSLARLARAGAKARR